jgi:hypothetical protein
VLWVLAVVGYAAACGPAIHQRGYPPIDPHVQARVFLWILPIGVSALFTRLTPVRVAWLVIYALLTAYFDASSRPVSVPNYIPMFERLLRMVVLFGPLHLMVAVVVEGASRAMRRLILSVRCGSRLENVLLGAGVVLMVAAGLQIPGWYAQTYQRHLQEEGVRRADRDWAARKLVKYVDDPYLHPLPGVMVQEFHDPETQARITWSRHGWEAAYNARVRTLVAAGRPAWMGAVLPPLPIMADHALRANFSPVELFPYSPAAAITIRRGSRGAAADIAWVEAAREPFPADLSGAAASVARDPAWPALVFVRGEKGEVYVYSVEGCLLFEVFRE